MKKIKEAVKNFCAKFNYTLIKDFTEHAPTDLNPIPVYTLVLEKKIEPITQESIFNDYTIVRMGIQNYVLSDPEKVGVGYVANYYIGDSYSESVYYASEEESFEVSNLLKLINEYICTKKGN